MSKLVTFRLSEDEYSRVRDLCFSKGIRNVSEMARTAINMLLTQPDRIEEQSIAARMNELDGKLHILALEVRRLHGLFHHSEVTVKPALSEP